MKNNNTLINGSVTKSLVSFTVPILLALFLQILYGSVDMFIVGNFGTVSDVSGVSTGSQLMNTITSICTGFAMGSTILIGQKIGQGQKKDVASIIFNSVVIFLAMAVAITVIILIFLNNIVPMLNTPSDAVEETTQYLLYCSIGIVMIFSFNILGSIFRGLGDSKTPLIAVGIACFFNIVGDLILVAVFKMGAGGAAIATVLAQTLSVVICIVIIRKKSGLLPKFEKRDLKIHSSHIKRILTLGAPVALQSGIVSISFLMITVVVNQFGVIFSASVGVTEKLTGIIMLIPIAFMQSMSVFVAQNYGASKISRAKKGMFVGMFISLAFGVIMFFFSFFSGEVLIRIFSSDEAVIKEATQYLKAYAFDTIFVAVMFCMTGYFSGCGKTVFVMIQAIVGAVLIRLPLTIILSGITPVSLFTIGLSTPIATLLQIVMCVVYYFMINKKLSALEKA